MNIIDLNKFRQDKLISSDVVEPDKSLDGSTYYFSINSIRVDFGGAFVRDLIEKIDQNKVEILSTIESINESNEDQLDDVSSNNEYEILKDRLSKQNLLMNEVVNSLETPHALDEMFQEGSKYLSIIGLLLTIVMVNSYSEFDYYKMMRDDWIIMTSSVEDFINGQTYQEIKALV